MAESLSAYIRSVETILNEQRVRNEIRGELAAVVPVVRKKIRTRALSTLPKGGGLNKWAAAIAIRANVAVEGDTVHVELRGGRNSQGGRADLKRLDAGRARHPAWGRRGKGQWTVTVVKAGFFTEPATEESQWREATDRALDKALEVIR